MALRYLAWGIGVIHQFPIFPAKLAKVKHFFVSFVLFVVNSFLH